MRRYLVVANQTLGGTELIDLIGRRAKVEPSEFFLIVPATPSIDFVLGAHAMPVMEGSPRYPTHRSTPAPWRRRDSRWPSLN